MYEYITPMKKRLELYAFHIPQCNYSEILIRTVDIEAFVLAVARLQYLCVD